MTTAKEFKNGNINIKSDAMLDTFETAILELNDTLYWLDTDINFEPVCFGNDCAAFTCYNYRTGNAYFLLDRDIEKLKNGHSIKLIAFKPNSDILDLFNC